MNVTDQLKESPLFKNVEPGDLDALVKVMKQQTYPVGHKLFMKGDAGDTMYIVLSGKVRIYTQDNYGNEITLAFFEPVRIFGDYAILDQQPRSASAEIVEAASLLSLTRDAFLSFLPQHPTVGMAMVRNLSEQVRHVTTYLSKVDDAIALLADGKYEEAVANLSASSVEGDIRNLARTFVEMVQAVREREEAARKK